MPKPRMFKMAGTWLWMCDHDTGQVGDTFPADQWRDPWTACLAAATKHSVAYHAPTPNEVD